MRDAMVRAVVGLGYVTLPWAVAGIALMLLILAFYGLIGIGG